MGVPALCFANVTVPSSPGIRAVKVCGLISEHDAAMVARSFRAIAPSHVQLLLGMILWPHSRRSISHEVARRIADVADKYDATPVGVFVDEDTDTIEKTCKNCGIEVAQLHGPQCRSAWPSVSAETSLRWIDVRDVEANGVVSPETSSHVGPPLWSLYDASGGGTGKPFDWDNFTPPADPWLLAGGLDPENVREAVAKLMPNGVDVASGVSGPDKCSKDEKRLRLFLERLSDLYA